MCISARLPGLSLSESYNLVSTPVNLDWSRDSFLTGRIGDCSLVWPELSLEKSCSFYLGTLSLGKENYYIKKIWILCDNDALRKHKLVDGERRVPSQPPEVPASPARRTDRREDASLAIQHDACNSERDLLCWAHRTMRDNEKLF